MSQGNARKGLTRVFLDDVARVAVSAEVPSGSSGLGDLSHEIAGGGLAARFGASSGGGSEGDSARAAVSSDGGTEGDAAGVSVGPDGADFSSGCSSGVDAARIADSVEVSVGVPNNESDRAAASSGTSFGPACDDAHAAESAGCETVDSAAEQADGSAGVLEDEAEWT